MSSLWFQFLNGLVPTVVSEEAIAWKTNCNIEQEELSGCLEVTPGEGLSEDKI